MGRSTNAVIAYGVQLEWEEDELPWGEETGFEGDPDDWLLALTGTEPEQAPFSDDEAWARGREARNEAVAALPFEVIEHCCEEEPMYIIAARGSSTVAYRGSPEDLSTMRSQSFEDKGLVDILLKAGHPPLDDENTPRWWLFAQA